MSFEEFHTLRKRHRAAAGLGLGMNNARKSKSIRKSDSTLNNDKEDTETDTDAGAGADQKQRERVEAMEDSHDQEVRSSLLSSDRGGDRNRLTMDGGISISMKTMGQIVESPEVQLLTIAFIYIHVVASTLLSVLLNCHVGTTTHHPSEATNNHVDNDNDDYYYDPLFEILLWTLSSISKVASFVCAFEIVILALAFGRTFFRHYGYILDLLVIAVIVTVETVPSLLPLPSPLAPLCRLFGFLRVWRISRYVHMNTAKAAQDQNHLQDLVQQEISNHEKTKLALDDCEYNLKEERESRNRMEKMLQGFIEEIDTLQEALNLAAIDVAGGSTQKVKFDDGSLKESHVMIIDKDGDVFYDGE